MKKSILILGQQGSGKTTKLKSLLSTNKTKFALDEAISVEDIQSILAKATEANSFCIVATQLNIKQIPLPLLAKFEIHKSAIYTEKKQGIWTPIGKLKKGSEFKLEKELTTIYVVTKSGFGTGRYVSVEFEEKTDHSLTYCVPKCHDVYSI